MGKCVGAPHPNTFPYTFPILLPTSFPHTPTHFLSPYTLPHFSTSHTSFLTSPHYSTHFPTPPPHSPYLFPQLPTDLPLHPTHFPTHPMHSPQIFPHSFDYVLCGEGTMWRCYFNKFNWKSPIKFLMTSENLKSCFGVGNVNMRCMKVTM